ncbi:hypothetical protein LQ564_10735 [Massilia sp. G4R7]|uniref:Uncharacterized protein n=1 Tax=Massilia phyllostachyos TaxID=2898585 RepID=A0ABS8Q4X3_9BURK|nr:hypothetical protein [Massilia phyllostachyos]MCD2516784.1 hypothetical protein [Massilia phyllostachyos]
MAATNIILGYGETLTQPFKLNRGSGDKKYPYNIAEQRESLGKQLGRLMQEQQAQPAIIKPRGESVARFTLHPAFLAKTHHPNGLLKASGLRCVGSRSAYVVPRNVASSRQRSGESLFTAALYVAGSDDAFRRLADMLFSTRIPQTHQKAFCRFELVQPFAASDKNYVDETISNRPTLEVVLHASAQDGDIVKAFARYAESLGGVADIARALIVSGLTFVPVRLPASKAHGLSAFQFVRAVRVMPSLRIGGREMRASSIAAPALPALPAIDTSLKVAVFDGGIGHSDLSQWVQETVLPGAESTSAAYLGRIGKTEKIGR